MRIKVRKAIAAVAAVGALAIGMAAAPATANITSGCTGGQVWLADSAQSKSCVAIGPSRYVAATPNMWSITVKRGTSVVLQVVSGPATPASATIATRKGDVVTVTTQPIRTSFGSVHAGFFVVG